jgi:hypothetical protein
MLVQPGLEKFLTTCVDIVSFVKKPILCIDECSGLDKRWHVQIRKNIAQVLLRNGSSNGADRSTKDSGRFSRKGVLTIWAPCMVNCILYYRGHGAVVFRRDEQDALRSHDLCLQLLDGLARVRQPMAGAILTIGISVGFGGGSVGFGPTPACSGNVTTSPHAPIFRIKAQRTDEE